MIDPIEILQAVDEQYNLQDHLDQCARFMLEVTSLCVDRFPLVGQKAFRIAKDYWFGLIPNESLDDIRVECWEYADSLTRQFGSDYPPVHAIRAAICFLYPKSKMPDAYETLSWFIIFFNRFEDKSVDEVRILSKIFQIC